MQMYSDIIFSANDAWGKYVYSFRINMKAHELSIEYQNNQGIRFIILLLPQEVI